MFFVLLCLSNASFNLTALSTIMVFHSLGKKDSWVVKDPLGINLDNSKMYFHTFGHIVHLYVV